MSADADVVVVGGGPAGLAAALELRRRGAGRVLVLERESTAGGVPRHTRHLGFGLRDFRRVLDGPAYAARYAQLAAAAGAEIRAGTSVTGWSGPCTLEVTSPQGRAAIAGRAVLLTTGCRERPRAARLVPGTRPLGVLTTGALQQLVYLHHEDVGARAVVVGAEHVSFSAILTLAHGGARAVAMVTELPRHQSYPLLARLTAGRQRVPILVESAVTRILGERRVEAVEVTDLATGAVRRLPCDTVVFTGDWIPDHELARMGGLEMDPATRAPRVDGALRTSLRGVFAAGNLLHAAETADVAALSGRHAARAIAAFLRDGAWPERPPVPILCEPPLRWVSPSAIDVAAQAARRGPGGARRSIPHGRFIMRVEQFRERAILEVRQGERTLWRRRYRRLIPARSIRAAAGWVRAVDADAGPVTFRVGP